MKSNNIWHLAVQRSIVASIHHFFLKSQQTNRTTSKKMCGPDGRHDMRPSRSVIRGGYNYDTPSILRPFDCLSKVIKVTVT